MTASNEILAYWLIPAEPGLTYFRSVIGKLSRQFDAPLFEPHLTLYVTQAGHDNAAEVLRKTLPGFQSPPLCVNGIDYSEKFTKTLFVQFRLDETLAKLSKELRSASASGCEYELNPHLSLIYKEMPRETKSQIASSLRLPLAEVEFDSVKAILSPARIETRDHVESWRVVATGELTG